MSRRSLFVKAGRYRVLLLRFEDAKHWESILGKYFGNGDASAAKKKLKDVNMKDYRVAAIDDDFRARVHFSESEVQRHLQGTVRWHTLTQHHTRAPHQRHQHKDTIHHSMP